MKCPSCKNEVNSDWKRCPYCDYSPNLCSNSVCKLGWLPTEAHFCPLCGSPVKGEEQLRLKEIIEKAIAEASPSVSYAFPNKASSNSELNLSVGGVSFKMIRVEGGSFMMGSSGNDSDANFDEKQHRVTLSDYYIGETQVTQALWKAVMGDNPSNWKGDTLPVETVSWEDCQEFIKQLNKKTGKVFRLPTEAQWEYAARGGRKSQSYKYAGSNDIDKVAWYAGNSEGKTHPVKQKSANELGLYDMSGNVWEWCQDYYDIYSVSSSSQTDPTGPSSGFRRVLRGGSWFCILLGIPRDCRVAYRNSCSPDDRNDYYGFRLSLVHQ